MVTLEAGLDAEVIAQRLGLPFHYVDDTIAEMCADGILSPA